ncbi:HAD family hydrolase [Bacillus marasmi]|uniref:HAD family hydrolase n=1 Tax=Bacillus marasmi TaxID=1926279 RepID=UPI00164D3CE8|nr:HAD-IA family hydrolase [Bacillus marasmi]
MELYGKEIKTVIFDKDGTLLDLPSLWIPWLMDIYQYLGEHLPSYRVNLNEIKLAFGVGVEDMEVDPTGPLAIGSIYESQIIVALKLYEHGVPWDLAVVNAKKSMDYANDRLTQSVNLRLLPNVRLLLEKLKQNGVRMGVLTADDTRNAVKQLDYVNISEYFDFIIGSDQVQNGKPFPDLVYLASERYELAPEEMMIIGDTNADMLLGVNAGMNLKVGIVPNKQVDTDYLRNADYIIRDYLDLMNGGEN